MKRLTQFGEYLCAPDTPTHEAVARINASAYLFQLIVDGNGRLLGTITDGDIRRGILHGVSLGDPAASCMQRKPMTGRVGADAENLKQLHMVGRSVAFLPLLDAHDVVREVWVGTEAPTDVVTALVMAGGQGTRLGERTRTTPKPLLPVGDKPILAHILDRLEDAQVSEIYIAVHYLAEQIEQFVAGRKNRARLHLLHESRPLGTAGALGKLSASDRGPILVMNSDVLTRTNITALLAFHRRHGYDGTIAVARYEVRIPFGIVRHTGDGLFSGIEEKPQNSYFVAAGIYCLSPEFTALVPPDKPIDMPELLNIGRGIGLRIGLFPIHEYWQDVGRQEDLEAAERDHEEKS